MKRIEVAIGERFHMLTILEELPIGLKGRIFSCRCDCGNIKTVTLPHLRRSLVKSCGCHRRNMTTSHGMWESREYASWENMIQRCTNPKARKYYLYGGRGITICDRWLNSFQAFYEDMGPRPDNTSLDRINGDDGYHKLNCKWSNPRQQLVNVRNFHQLIRIGDECKSIEEWLAELNIDRELFKSRVLRGHSFKQALFGEMDIAWKNVKHGQTVIHHLSQFLNETGFEKQKILELLDRNHEEPYQDYLVRYLADFNGWPDKHT